MNIKTFSDVAVSANPTRWYERTAVQVLTCMLLIFGGFLLALNLQDRGAAMLGIDSAQAMGLYVDAQNALLICASLALVAMLAFLWVNHRRHQRSVSVYIDYLATLGTTRMQWVALSPEMDSTSRSVAANYLNRTWPGWSKFLLPTA